MTNQTYEVRLISGDYKLDADENITIELYGHTKDGRSIIIRDKMENLADRPYCYIVEPDLETTKYLENKREILRTESIELYHRGSNRKCLKITTRIPKNVKKLREDPMIKAEFLAADIPFHLRYIYDNDLSACIKVTGSKALKRDYVTDILIDKIKYEPTETFNPKLRILSFDIENSLKGDVEIDPEAVASTEDDVFYDKRVLCICCVLQESDKIVATGRFSGDERKIFEDFSNFIKEHDPDVISGYNIEGYDLRVIKIRTERLGMGLPWGRDGSNLAGHKDPKYNKINWGVNGRIIIDAWWAVKMELKPKQESLGAVSTQLLGQTKLDVDPKKMDEEWKNNPEKVLEYCEKDAELSLLILNKLERVRKIMDLGTVSKMPLAEVNKNRSSLLIDSILIRAADRAKAGVPLSGAYRDDDEAIEGAYVHELNPGLYNWVCVLDFKSMYPSVIISKNICFTTISEQGTIESPIGVKFLDKTVKKGLLPKILEDLMKYREDTKKKMKDATTPEEKAYYDGLQGAVKIYMNSFYGVFASSFYRFTDKHIGASVTAFSRETTKGIINDIEKNGNKVLYSDTDSIFVKSPIDALEGSIEFGKKLAELYSKEGGQLEFEKIFQAMFSHGKKKRYVGKTAWPKVDMIIRGYEIRRTDSFDIQSDTMMTVFNKILDNNIDEAIKTAKDMVQDVLKGKVDVNKLIISKGCRVFSAYAKPDSQSTVQTAKKLQALGYEFIPGMKVSWIVTNAKETPQEVTPFIQGKKFESTPDWKYYADRMAQTLSRITEVYGVSAKDLLAGNIQASLSDSFEDGAKKKYTVTDYM
jgi:DNA polymerase I